MRFTEFLGLVPRAERLPLQGSYAEKSGIREPDENLRFVEPTLREVRRVEPGRTSVVLVSAPGAVGKTTLAAQLARHVGSPLWDLGGVSVGHDTLDGSIAKTFGDEAFPRVMREIARGERLLVVDALDEAKLRAGEQNFEAFLESVAERFRTSGGRPSLVLLGRSGVVEETEDWLELLDVQAARYEIEYFERSAAEDFIHRYIKHHPRSKHPHEANATAFGQARDLVLGALEKAVPEGVDPRTVAGYAPVLMFVGELLNVGDPYGLLRQIDRQLEDWANRDPLAEVAKALLERESLKLVDRLKERVVRRAPEFSAWDRLYTAEEQCIRLSARKFAYDLKSRPPRELPDPLRDDYEDGVRGWLEEHPFRDHAVFEEYLYAWLLVQTGLEPGLREAARKYLQQGAKRKYLPTPLLAGFARALGEGSRNELVIEAADFGFLYESLLAGEASDAKLTLASFEVDADIEGEIGSSSPAQVGRGGQRERPLRLRLRNSEKGVWFWRRLQHADVNVGRVRIGSGDSDFTLGPDVEVECDSLSCAAPALRVLAREEQYGVSLSARIYAGETVPEFVGRDDERRFFRVAWEPLEYPWIRYRSQHDDRVVVTAEVRDAHNKLRRILVCFRAQGYNDIARHQDLIDNPVVAGSGMARELLRFCLDKDLIQRDPPWYRLNRDAMDRYGINWADIRERRLSADAARFLSEFVAWRKR